MATVESFRGAKMEKAATCLLAGGTDSAKVKRRGPRLQILKTIS